MEKYSSQEVTRRIIINDIDGRTAVALTDSIITMPCGPNDIIRYR